MFGGLVANQRPDHSAHSPCTKSCLTIYPQERRVEEHISGNLRPSEVQDVVFLFSSLTFKHITSDSHDLQRFVQDVA